MTDDKQQIRDQIVEKFLGHVPFDGWSQAALVNGARDAGYDEGMALRLFTGGMRQVAEHFSGWSDRRMQAELDKIDVDSLKIRARIFIGIKTRLQLNAPYREAIRRLLSYLALPGNAGLATHMAWQSSSVIWYWAGDRSADWNYYSKRGLLASVYSSTILYWLADDPDEDGDFPETWAFLERRIEDVLRLFGLPERLLGMLPGRGRIFSKPATGSGA